MKLDDQQAVHSDLFPLENSFERNSEEQHQKKLTPKPGKPAKKYKVKFKLRTEKKNLLKKKSIN